MRSTIGKSRKVRNTRRNNGGAYANIIVNRADELADKELAPIDNILDKVKRLVLKVKAEKQTGGRSLGGYLKNNKLKDTLR